MAMQQVSSQTEAESAMAHLSAADPIMALLVQKHGSVALRATDDYFFTLVESIASQQLSSKAADTIIGRVRALVPGEGTPDAESILAIPNESLRGAGLSWSKVNYI